MLQWIQSNLATIIGAAIVLGIFLAIVFNGIRKRKKGQSGCGCGCDGCPSANLCHPHPSKN